MKLKIKENSVTLQEVKEALEKEFGNKNKVGNYYSKVVSVAKSKLIGANDFVFKNKIIVKRTFPTIVTNIIIVLCFILPGIVTPLFLVFHKKMKAIEKEVGDFIKKEYSDILIN